MLALCAGRFESAAEFVEALIGGGAIDREGTALPRRQPGAGEERATRCCSAPSADSKWDNPQSTVRPGAGTARAAAAARGCSPICGRSSPIPRSVTPRPLKREAARGRRHSVRARADRRRLLRPAERAAHRGRTDARRSIRHCTGEARSRARRLAYFGSRSGAADSVTQVDKANISGDLAPMARGDARDRRRVSRRHLSRTCCVDAMAMHLAAPPARFRRGRHREHVRRHPAPTRPRCCTGSLGMLPSASLGEAINRHGGTASVSMSRSTAARRISPDATSPTRSAPFCPGAHAARVLARPAGGGAGDRGRGRRVLEAGLRTADVRQARLPTIGCARWGEAVREQLATGAGMSGAEYVVVLVGAASETGREVSAVLRERAFPVGGGAPATTIERPTMSCSTKTLSDADICPLGETDVEGADVVFLCHHGGFGGGAEPRVHTAAGRADRRSDAALSESGDAILGRTRGQPRAPSPTESSAARSPVRSPARSRSPSYSADRRRRRAEARRRHVVRAGHQQPVGSNRRARAADAATLLSGVSPDTTAFPAAHCAFNLIPQVGDFVFRRAHARRVAARIADCAVCSSFPICRITATSVYMPVFFGQACAVARRDRAAARGRRGAHAAARGARSAAGRGGTSDYPTLGDIIGSEATHVGRVRDDPTGAVWPGAVGWRSTGCAKVRRSTPVQIAERALTSALALDFATATGA